MKLTDIVSAEEWQQLAKEIYDRFRLNGAVVDKDGTVVHPPLGLWANKICPLIKGGTESRAVCASAQQTMANNAGADREAVIAKCDVGFTKFVVPIFFDNEFLGTAGGCGVVSEQDEVDGFYISKVLNMKESEIREPAKSIRTVSADDVKKAVNYVEEAVKKILSQVT